MAKGILGLSQTQIWLGGAGLALAYWWFALRTNLKVDNVDRAKKIVDFTFNGKPYRYDYTDPSVAMGAVQQSLIWQFTVDAKVSGDMVVITISRNGKIVRQEIINQVK